MSIRYLSGINVDSNVLFVDSANNRVGVGTGSPADKLHVNAGSVGGIRIQADTEPALYLNTTDGTSNVNVFNSYGNFGIEGLKTTSNYIMYHYGGGGTAANQYTYFQTAGVERMRITGAGNVGIGTTSPGSLLQVGYQNSTTDSLIRLGVSYAGDRSARGGITWHDSGNVTGKIFTEFDGSMVSMVFGSLYNSGYNSNQLMIIRGNGNVGIGTTAPDSSLEVNGRISIRGANELYFGQSTSSIGSWTTRMYASGSTQKFNANEFIFNNEGYGLSEFLRITSAGNVGIGTASPAAKLDVDSTGYSIYANNSAGNRIVKLGTHSASGEPAIQASLSNGTARYLMLNPGGGDVLIGTTVDYSKLTVSNGTSTRSGITISDTNTSSLMMIAGASAPASISFDSFGLRFVGGSTVGTDNGSEFMRITTDGNVGIGVTSPGAKLDVNGYIASSRYYPYNSNSTYIYGDTGGLSIGGSGYMYVNTPGGSYFQSIARFRGGISNDAGPYLHIYGGSSDITYFAGTIGVGTTTPSQSLHVVGNVRVTGAYYDSNNEAGTGGQVLTSNGSGTDWVTPYTSVATSLYDLLPAARVAYNWTGQVVNDTWVDIFSAANNVLTTGTWMIEMYISDWAQGGAHYSYTYTGVMRWYQESVNQGGESAASEIYLHRMGHAANSNVLYLRTTEMTAVSGGIGKLQVKANYSNTSNTTINFKFVKIF